MENLAYIPIAKARGFTPVLGNWTIAFTPEAREDFRKLDGSVKPHVAAAIRKTSQNPLPQREGGYGVELGNKAGLDLTGCLKIKLKKAGIRIVYQLERHEDRIEVIVIGIRSDLEVYREAVKRLGIQQKPAER